MKDTLSCRRACALVGQGIPTIVRILAWAYRFKETPVTSSKKDILCRFTHRILDRGSNIRKCLFLTLRRALITTTTPAENLTLWVLRYWRFSLHRVAGLSTTLKLNRWARLRLISTELSAPHLKAVNWSRGIKSFTTLERIHKWMLINTTIILTSRTTLARPQCTSGPTSTCLRPRALLETTLLRSTSKRRSTPDWWCPARAEVAVLRSVATLTHRWQLPLIWMPALIWIFQLLTVTSTWLVKSGLTATETTARKVRWSQHANITSFLPTKTSSTTGLRDSNPSKPSPHPRTWWAPLRNK